MSDSEKLWNRFADGYAKSPIKDLASYEKKLDIARQYLRDDMEVLEIGCGTGTTAIALSRDVKNIVATDVSSRMLEIAQSKANDEGCDNIRFQKSTVENLPFSALGFDAVLGHSILHLLRDKDTAIAKVHSLLRPGGIFISSTACLGDTLPFLKYLLPIPRVLGLLPFVAFFTQTSLIESIEKAGFKVEHCWQPKSKASVFVIAVK